jgi:hypothetical protein
MESVVRIGGMVLVGAGLLAMILALSMPAETIGGLTLGTGAVLLVGGFVTLALSGLTAAIDALRVFVVGDDHAVAGLEDGTGGFMRPLSESSTIPANGAKPRATTEDLPGRREPGIGSHAAGLSKEQGDRISIRKESAGPTIESIAEEVHDFVASPAGPPEQVSEDELYVVEERTIAGKPARILSDGTVEAETDEGWMRFENIEHLEEYLDAARTERG